MKILLVDDSKSARYALRLQLQRYGVEVETADSAEAALELLEGDLPDAIFMDHMMPGLNGFEALEVIREEPRTAHLPVVMCTSHEDPDFAAAARRKGVIDILPKSVAPEKLPDILAQLRVAIATATQVRAPALELPTLTAAEGPAPAEASPAVAAAAALASASGRSQREIDALVDARIAAQLDRRLDQRIEARITGLLDDLRRELLDRLGVETRRLIESRLAEERQARDAARPEKEQAAFNALAERLSSQTLPDLVKIEIEAERGHLMDLVEQYLNEFTPRVEPGQSEAQRQALEGGVLGKAQDIARRECREAVDPVLDRSLRMDQALQRIKARLGTLSIAVALAALAGVGAAAAVFVVLTR